MAEVTPVDPRVERTRARVLASTAELVGTAGFGRVTMEAVAAHSGVARSTVYRHWPNLALLLLEAVRTHGHGLEDPASGTLRDDLVAMFGALARSLDDPRARGMVADVIAEAHRDDEVAALNRTFEATRRRGLVAVLERGRARGELPPDTDVERLADDLAAPFFFRVVVRGEPIDADHVAAHVDRWLALAAAGWVSGPSSSAGATPRRRRG